ncbi:MAG: hypothetical protein ACRD88_16520 [Terriglobia bacterium]
MKQFESLEAVSLYCPRCKQAMPVRKRLLLALPDSEIHEYLCSGCGASVGKKSEPIVTRPPGSPSDHPVPKS